MFGRTSSAIFAHLRPHGGIRSAPRRRSRHVLSIDEREEISRGIAAGGSLRSIAARLHRAPSTISRELLRNGDLGRYRAAAADRRAWQRALRPKPCKLAMHDQLRQLVAARLEENWSPEQIAGWLKHTYPGDEAYQVSHETIYRRLFVQARGVLKKDLQAHLRSGRAIRRSRHASSKGDQRGSIVDAISTRERPASVEDRAVPGHWEGDLLCGSLNSYIVTLVERHPRYVLLAKVTNRDSRSVITALIEQAKRLPDELLKSLTWDPARRWRSISGSLWRPMLRSTFAIRRVRGSAAPKKIPRSIPLYSRTLFTFVGLIATLREEASTPEQQALITDLFERITLYDLRVDQPTAVERPDGRWDGWCRWRR
jgi:IS30 family transposase